MRISVKAKNIKAVKEYLRQAARYNKLNVEMRAET